MPALCLFLWELSACDPKIPAPCVKSPIGAQSSRCWVQFPDTHIHAAAELQSVADVDAALFLIFLL